MEYYHCPIDDLDRELRRRGYDYAGSNNPLSEALQRDDEERGADATTVSTYSPSIFAPRQLKLTRSAQFGTTAPANLLVNETIVHWTLNTFFSTLQLFFASGRSCTIGSELSDSVVGLDPELRFRLTDCTHGEEGRITKSIQPMTSSNLRFGVKIKAAVTAQRTSVAAKPGRMEMDMFTHSVRRPATTIVEEVHAVVGLRLEGMKNMGFIWAKSRISSGCDAKTWGDVRIAGLRDDAPSPLLGLPRYEMKPGAQVEAVTQGSVVSEDIASSFEKTF